jgi:pimeloyl-ACP methyl ester carboxylesterase
MFKILTLLLAVYALMCLFLYVKQRTLMYYPTAPVERPDTQVFWLENQGERLKIWRINEGDKTLLYFGGNAEAVEDNIPEFRQRFPTHSIYIANYRGYGGSSGQPGEQALFSDALALYDEVAGSGPVQVIGRSLGSGVAMWLASQRRVDKLVLVTPYDSITRLAQSHYPIFPVRWLLRDHFDSISRVDAINSPTLVLLSEVDATVPHRHSIRLIEALGDKVVDTITIPGTAHNDIDSDQRYLDELSRFLNVPASG